MSKFTLNTVLGSLVLSGALVHVAQNRAQRAPASVQAFELELSAVKLELGSQVKHLNKAFIRATFNRTDVLELGKAEAFSLQQGEVHKLDAVIPIKPQWIQNDQLEFKIEIVEQGFVEHIAVRCATVSSHLSAYNRTYQCMAPGETNPLLTYRLTKKGGAVEALAKN